MYVVKLWGGSAWYIVVFILYVNIIIYAVRRKDVLWHYIEFLLTCTG